MMRRVSRPVECRCGHHPADHPDPGTCSTCGTRRPACNRCTACHGYRRVTIDDPATIRARRAVLLAEIDECRHSWRTAPPTTERTSA